MQDKIREAVPPGSHVNAIVHNIDFVNTKLTEGQYFFTDIAHEGIMLFDAGRHRLAAAKELSAEERRSVAQQEYDHWFASAQQFFDIYEYTLAKDQCSVSAFQLHQATERFYSAALLVFTGHKPKTHDLGELGRLATAQISVLVRVFLHATEEERRRFDLLSRAYVDSRYSLDYAITREDLEYLGARVRELKSLVEDACRKKIESLVA